MKQKAILFLFSLSLLLSGCSVFQQSYVSVQPHKEQRQTLQPDVIMAANYLELLGALEDMIASGTEVAAVKVPEYPEGNLEYGMKQAVRHSMQNDPIGSYAVSDIVFEKSGIRLEPEVRIW